MLRVLVALLFIVGGGIMGWISLTKEDFCILCDHHADSSSLGVNSFQNALISDLKAASKAKELPKVWGQILEVRYLYHSKKVQKLLEKNPIVAINKKGDKRLLVEFFDEPGSDDFVMVRYSLMDVASGNTVGEINRRLKWIEPKPKPQTK